MPFNAGGQTYIGGQLLSQGFQNLGQGIGGGIIQALDEQRKKQQLTDQIMLQALQTGQATPEQYLEYSKKNTKGKQDFAMTIAANFADDYAKKIKGDQEAQAAQTAAAQASAGYQKAHTAQLTTQQDLLNQALSWSPTEADKAEAAKIGHAYTWDPTKGFQLTARQGTGQTLSNAAPTPEQREVAKKAGYDYLFDPSKQVWDIKKIETEKTGDTAVPSEEKQKEAAKAGYSYLYDPAKETYTLQQVRAEGDDSIKFQPVMDPANPGQHLPGKVLIVGPGKTARVENFRVGGDSPFRTDPKTGIMTFVDESGNEILVPGDVMMKARLAELMGQQGSGGGGNVGGTPQMSWWNNLLYGPSQSPAPGPTVTPTATPRPTATPAPTATPRPTATPAPSATPTGSPIDQILQQIGGIPATASAQQGPVQGGLEQILQQISGAARTGKEATQGKRKKLDKATATQLLIETGGDKEAARNLAIERGYDVK